MRMGSKNLNRPGLLDRSRVVRQGCGGPGDDIFGASTLSAAERVHIERVIREADSLAELDRIDRVRRAEQRDEVLRFCIEMAARDPNWLWAVRGLSNEADDG